MFGWGANSHAQLGLGCATEQCDRPEPLIDVPFRAEEIECVAAGGGHTLVGTTAGRLYGCGWNNRGQLGVGHTADSIHFLPIGEFGFKRLFAGWDVSAGINASGELFVWGSNSWQQIANGGVKHVPTPTRLQLPDGGRVLKVVFGLQYMAVLVDSGRVWVLGKCKFLANDYPLEQHTSLTMRSLSDRGSVRDIASGDCHLVLLTDDRRIECLGDNKHGQCLSGTTMPDYVAKLESGWTHSACLTRNGEAYLWGRNNLGQLGHHRVDSAQLEKLRLETNETVLRDVSLGSQHGAALTADGRVFCWGWNEHGNCGIGGVENVLVPKLVELPVPASKVVCGAGYTLAFT